MTLLQYRNYFEALAADSKQIAHTSGGKYRFALINFGDTLIKVRNKLDVTNYCLILEKFDAKQTRRSLSANTQVFYDCSFRIVKAVKSEDFEQELATQSEALNLAKEFIKKIVKDYQDGTFLSGVVIEQDTIDYLLLSNQAENMAGASCFFRLSETTFAYKKDSCGTDTAHNTYWTS